MHTLLLADDHSSVRTALRRIIQSDSRISLVAEASNLAETLSLCARFQPSILLLDLHLPDQTAFDAAFVKDQLGANCHWILAMSIWQDSESAELAQSYGAIRILDKATLALDLPRVIDTLPEHLTQMGMPLSPALIAKQGNQSQ